MNGHRKIYHWKQIQNDFTEGIILGNGSSMAIHDGFSFASLFDNAEKSEGTSEQKLQAINRSSYLMSVYSSVIGNIGSRVVTFCWSIGDQDDHILNAICSNDHIESLAVSVVVSEDEDIVSKCSHVEKKIRETKGDNRFEVVFFDAKSKGCWANS